MRKINQKTEKQEKNKVFSTKYSTADRADRRKARHEKRKAYEIQQEESFWNGERGRKDHPDLVL